MPTFTPPVHAEGVPPVLTEGDPDAHPLGQRLMRYFKGRPGGDNTNVYYRIISGEEGLPGEVGEVTDVAPYTTYNPDGSVLVDGWADVAHVWWGGHVPEEVTPAQQTALEAGGYTVTP